MSVFGYNGITDQTLKSWAPQLRKLNANVESNASNILTNTTDIATINTLLALLDPNDNNLEWQDWTPTWTAKGSMTLTSVTLAYAKYLELGDAVFVQIRASAGTLGGTASNEIYASAPSAVSLSTDNTLAGPITHSNGGWGVGFFGYGGNGLIFTRGNVGVWTIGALGDLRGVGCFFKA